MRLLNSWGEWMKVLIVDDEAELLKRLTILFESQGYECQTLSSYQDLKEFADKKKAAVNLIVLDRLLGGQDSATLIPRLKSTFSKTHILVLSAVDTALEKAEALDAGADDYLAKPFSSVELMARVKALTRRISLYESDKISLKNLDISLNERQAQVGNAALNLTPKEVAVLHLLAVTPGKVYSKEALLEMIWKQKADLETKVVEVAINKIRRELSESQAEVSIKNVRNVGYWIEG